MKYAISDHDNEMKKADKKLHEIFIDSVRHGFFEFTVSGTMENGKRLIRIMAGKSHQYTIRQKELSEFNRDFWDGSTNYEDEK